VQNKETPKRVAFEGAGAVFKKCSERRYTGFWDENKKYRHFEG
jgi:hypothetical protein